MNQGVDSARHGERKQGTRLLEVFIRQLNEEIKANDVAVVCNVGSVLWQQTNKPQVTPH